MESLKASEGMYSRFSPVAGLSDQFVWDLRKIQGDLVWAWEHLRSAESESWELFGSYVEADLCDARHSCECLRVSLERSDNRIASYPIFRAELSLEELIRAAIATTRALDPNIQTAVIATKKSILDAHQAFLTLQSLIVEQPNETRDALGHFTSWRGSEAIAMAIAKYDDPIADFVTEVGDMLASLQRTWRTNSVSNVTSAVFRAWRLVELIFVFYRVGIRPSDSGQSAAKKLPQDVIATRLSQRGKFDSRAREQRSPLVAIRQSLESVLDRLRDWRDFGVTPCLEFIDSEFGTMLIDLQDFRDRLSLS